MGILSDVTGWVLSWRRQKVEDTRATSLVLAEELEKLADLLDAVLEVTDADGSIIPDRLPELNRMRTRVWNRWVSMLGTSGYATQDFDLQEQIEKCIRIAHAAPGAYVEEIYLAQIGISQGRIAPEVRERFAESVDALRDLVSRTRLDAHAR